MRFAVGKNATLERQLDTEAAAHDDLARLGCPEDGSVKWTGGRKLWHTLVWAVVRRPLVEI